MNLTIAYITARRDPKIEWFFDSLLRQLKGDNVQIIVIDLFFPERILSAHVKTYQPKPNFWQGLHRQTKEDWWAKSNALNTAICLCETDWIAFVDDRSVLMPGWLGAVKRGMQYHNAVCGNFEKHHNLKVEDGIITDMGTLDGKDDRPQKFHRTRDWYGGSGVVKLEWCLKVNGFAEELCDSLGSEDSVFGINLRNLGVPIWYDPEMKIIEDRTPGQIDGGLKRTDKGVSPNDKSHRIIDIVRDKVLSGNSYDIRQLRDHILTGGSFPVPTPNAVDWYDGQPVSEFE